MVTKQHKISCNVDSIVVRHHDTSCSSNNYRPKTKKVKTRRVPDYGQQCLKIKFYWKHTFETETGQFIKYRQMGK